MNDVKLAEEDPRLYSIMQTTLPEKDMILQHLIQLYLIKIKEKGCLLNVLNYNLVNRGLIQVNITV